MGPVGELGILLLVAHALGLSLAVAAFCSLLPDLVDKSLWVLGIGNGRYVAHTLLFVFVVAIFFSLKNKRYGLSALVAGVFHLLLDWSVPWFYPFVGYDFPEPERGLLEILHEYFSFSWLGKELIWVALLWLAMFLYLWLRKRTEQRAYHDSQYKQ